MIIKLVAAVFADDLRSTFMPNDVPTQIKCNPVPTDLADLIGAFNTRQVATEIQQHAKKKEGSRMRPYNRSTFSRAVTQSYTAVDNNLQ